MFNHVRQPEAPGYYQAQYSYYAEQLSKTHQDLSTQYRRLSDIEKRLEERLELGITRKDKKKLQWSRALTRKTIGDLETQQSCLSNYLCQWNAILGIYGRPNDVNVATSCLRPPPLQLHHPDYSSPGASGTQGQGLGPWTQYWDLSWLRSRRRSSSNHSCSTDSGFYEPCWYPTRPGYGMTADCPVFKQRDDNSAMKPHESISMASTSSEKDDVPGLPPPASQRTRRRYSENAIDVAKQDESTHRHERVRSLNDVSSIMTGRTGSGNFLVGESCMATTES